MGSLFKRGKHWYIRYYLPEEVNGRRKEKMQSCKGMNRQEAHDTLARIEAELSRGTYIDPSQLTLAAYLAQWLDHQKNQVSPLTHRRYMGMIDKSVLPRLGQLRLNRLTPIHLSRLYADLLKEGRDDGSGGLAPKTVKCIHGVLHAALAQAVRWQLIPLNPADNVDPPKVRRPEIRVTDQAGILRLVDAIQDSPFKVPIMLALTTGMRRAEICGLRWEDFDPARETIAVRRSIAQLSGEQVLVKDTKTGIVHAILLPASIAQMLDEHRKAQEESGADHGGWICTHPDGKHILPDPLGKGFRRLAKKANVDITLHGLRHSQATMLLMAGVPAKVVSERLGHSTITITNDLYAHVLPTMQREAADLMEQVITNSKPQIKVIEGGKS